MYLSRDYAGSGSVYETPDSGGECGVAYETYFPMPAAGKDKPWYSIEQGSVHFIVMSTEHSWSHKSEQVRSFYQQTAVVRSYFRLCSCLHADVSMQRRRLV